MAVHDVFRFKSLCELTDKITELGVYIPLTDDISPLRKAVPVGSKIAPNALVVLPMEGCDSESDGSPSELVRRRYLRFASGGAGLLWWEACSVVPEGRANPLQMMLTKDNVGRFADLLEESINAATTANGSDHKPVNILQLTHSGRYSRPETHAFEPIIAQHDPLLDPRVGLDKNSPLVSDTYLESLVEHYVTSAKLAKEAGFDGVDVKACHRYLLNELLASYTRDGKYGGSFENRSRLLLEIVTEIKNTLGDDFIVASRYNVFDAHPYLYGFGAGKDDFMLYDLSEPITLTHMLCDSGAELLGISAGNPYYIYPQVTRPFDNPPIGVPVPQEHPLESAARLFSLAADIQAAAGKIPVVGTGYTWLRRFIPNAGAANIALGRCGFVGIGRSGFAYPDAPRDMLAGKMSAEKCCVTCSKCTQIMRDHGKTGCVIKDSDVYAPLFMESREEAASRGK